MISSMIQINDEIAKMDIDNSQISNDVSTQNSSEANTDIIKTVTLQVFITINKECEAVKSIASGIQVDLLPKVDHHRPKPH